MAQGIYRKTHYSWPRRRAFVVPTVYTPAIVSRLTSSSALTGNLTASGPPYSPAITSSLSSTSNLAGELTVSGSTVPVANAFYAARVWETGTLTATSTVINLPNVAAVISGDGLYRTFASAAPPTGSLVAATVVATTTGGSWEQSIWQYVSGSPGTLTRVQFLESSTGAAINWSGVAASILLDLPPPVVTSAGAASAGLVPALGLTGVLDSSVVPASTGGSSGFPPYPWAATYYSSGFGVVDSTYGATESTFTEGGWQLYWPFLWEGSAPIQNVGAFVKTASTTTGAALLLNMFPVNADLTWGTPIQLTPSGGLVVTATGSVIAALPMPTTAPPGVYMMQMAGSVASMVSPSLGAFRRVSPNIAMLQYYYRYGFAIPGFFSSGLSVGVLLANSGAITLATAKPASFANITVSGVWPDIQLGT